VRVDVSPREIEVRPEIPVDLAITIANTSTVIGGYVIRVLGADPSWIALEDERVSLFPDETRTVHATITVPRGLSAGVRRIAVQVRELTPPHANTVDDIDLFVPEREAVAFRLDPLAVTAGRKGTYSVLVENTGNTLLRARPAGDDPEGKVEFRFEPPVVRLAPGDHAVVDLRIKARRRLLGSPVVRTFNLYLDKVEDDAFFAERADAAPPAPREEADALAIGTLIQRAFLARGALALLGLLAAVSVFALVITIALSRLAGQSAADRNLVLQIAAAQNATGKTGTSGLAGTVTSITSVKPVPVPGVAVQIFDAADTKTPIATTATDDHGVYRVNNLAAGDYKIEFQGAGLQALWYPAALTDADGTKVTVKSGQEQAGLDVKVGGSPATISGTITGDDVSASTLFLKTIGPAKGSTTNASTPNVNRIVPVGTGTTTPPDDGTAVVQTIPIGADGAFSLTNVLSPARYELVVVKAGYATSQQVIDVGAGETRTGVNITLDKGDGLIAGTVTSGSGPLSDVTITATSGQTAVNTVSVAGGSFTMPQLPTPATYTLLVTKPGYASQTLTTSLTAGQRLKGLAITLSTSAGSLAGTVTIQRPHQADIAATGVAVTITDGQLTVQTETQSVDEAGRAPGQWNVQGLPLPGTYTVTFSRLDLATEIVSVSLDATGHITPGSRGTTFDANGNMSVRMKSATATVAGWVKQAGAGGCAGNLLGEATVSLSSGTSTYTVTTASVPSRLCGQYRIENVPPGTYTLTANAGTATAPQSQVVTLTAGDELVNDSSGLGGENFSLPQPASLSGIVRTTIGDRLCGWTVALFPETQYPTKALASTTTSGDPAHCGSADGVFQFRAIPAGDYIISVGPTPSNPVATLRVTVRPSDPKSVTITVTQ